ncbi:hypothetical protein MNBD_GAMMA08-307 [hydrothermal vent metagenome]|uniref:Cohesin domain-containing protein n=1 Tax=hydrothermal vent metagenome TaxID=652676 RepID=A0A3B0WV35_9ZZZZ
MNFMTKRLMLVIVTLFLSTGGHAATVSLSPASLVVGINETFTLELTGSDFNSGTLDGGGVNINFDPTVINVTNVVINTDVWEFYSTAGVIDNLAGTVNDISFNSFVTRTGNLNFATIEFTAVGSGVSALSLTENFFNPFATNGTPYLDLTFDQSISVSVQSVPVPAAVWLFISGLALVATQRRKLSIG